MSEQQPKLTRAEVEQLLERAKAVPSISFGYIRLAQYCLELMDALEPLVRESCACGRYGQESHYADCAWYHPSIVAARAVLPASEEATDER